jgi:hypothetical protein
VDRYGFMESDEYEKYEKQQNQTISFDILDKSEMNSDGNEEEDGGKVYQMKD